MTAGNTSSGLAREALGALVTRVAGLVLTFGSMMVLARWLGPAEFGVYSSALSLAMLLATLAPCGTDRVLARNLAIGLAPNLAARELRLTHKALIVSAAGLIPGLLVIGACLRLAGHTDAARIAFLATLMFPALALSYVRQWVATVLLGARRALLPEQTILPGCLLIAGLTGVLSSRSVTATTLVALHAILVSVIWWLSLRATALRPLYRDPSGGNRVEQPHETWRRVQDGLPFLLVASGAVASQSAMPLVIAAACGATDAGLYALAVPFAALPAIPLGVFNLVMMPRCARHYGSGDRRAADHDVRCAATAGLWLGSLISLIVWVGSPWVSVLVGRDYSAAIPILPAMLLAAVIDSLTGPTVPVMQTMHMERWYARALIAYLPVQILFTAGIGSGGGASGAAVGWLLSRVIWNFVIVRKIKAVTGLTMLPYWNLAAAIRRMPMTGESKAARAIADRRAA
jgi:O-antigen/teichoic acid export membrane protein